VIADAVAEGLKAKHSKVEEAEPLAEWEKELLEAPAAAVEEAPAAEETKEEEAK
jgi:small subunit ribosomal protein S2